MCRYPYQLVKKQWQSGSTESQHPLTLVPKWLLEATGSASKSTQVTSSSVKTTYSSRGMIPVYLRCNGIRCDVRVEKVVDGYNHRTDSVVKNRTLRQADSFSRITSCALLCLRLREGVDSLEAACLVGDTFGSCGLLSCVGAPGENKISSISSPTVFALCVGVAKEGFNFSFK
eukprot:gb/GECG01005060.1/.p1 GENE.gb/GECG01005060.1/~~gb/GECG01005060.1/.p1  ORF type:complete len:173 (+),score=9.45 gb/GECG01005060.1/:1-519(+)